MHLFYLRVFSIDTHKKHNSNHYLLLLAIFLDLYVNDTILFCKLYLSSI